VRLLAIIPARSGSKRIPCKNIRKFFGRPIIEYSIETARDCGLFDAIHVSTDSESIRDIAVAMGADCKFVRPSHLADDTTPLRDVLRFVRDSYAGTGSPFDIFCRISACAPLLRAEDLIAAYSLMADLDYQRPVTSVRRYSAPLFRAHRMDPRGLLHPIEPDKLVNSEHGLTPLYHDVGSFSFLPDRTLDLEGTAYFQNRIGYIMPLERAVDIDDEADWRLAEILFAGQKMSG
jgi:pseudaminic acid cytidylyltransferase